MNRKSFIGTCLASIAGFFIPKPKMILNPAWVAAPAIEIDWDLYPDDGLEIVWQGEDWEKLGAKYTGRRFGPAGFAPLTDSMKKNRFRQGYGMHSSSAAVCYDEIPKFLPV